MRAHNVQSFLFFREIKKWMRKSKDAEDDELGKCG